MSRAQRGGLTLKTGIIGRVNCLRQQVLMPGESMDISLNGNVRLESLRERDVMRVNAHLGIFMQPLRWCMSNFPTYLKEGPDTAETIPTDSTEESWAKYGIGSWRATPSASYGTHFKNSYLNVVNNWYKWPEDPDVVNPGDDGARAVPLSKDWTRCRYSATPDDTGDYQIDVSGSNMDVRDLAEVQAKFRGAMKRDIFSYGRYMELVNEMYGADASREVDQVPMMLDQVDVGVDPRELPATDGPSLGTWQSLYDFGVNHQVKNVVAPEHMILTYILTVRFAAITETAHPLANVSRLDWHEFVGDPEYLDSAAPVEVQRRDIFQNNSSTSLGYLPAGWQWRTGHDVIGKRVDERNSFPYMQIPTTKEEAKDATRIKNAFTSVGLGHYLADIYITENSFQPIGDSIDSYMSGMYDQTTPRTSGRGDEFPKGGKML
jgi:hypothetical protein